MELVEVVRGRDGETQKNMLIGGVRYTFIIAKHSPGGTTVLLCLICYVIGRAAGWGVGDKVVVELVGV